MRTDFIDRNVSTMLRTIAITATLLAPALALADDPSSLNDPASATKESKTFNPWASRVSDGADAPQASTFGTTNLTARTPANDAVDAQFRKRRPKIGGKRPGNGNGNGGGVGVPELDPTAWGGALVLLVGGFLVIRGRRAVTA